jgi:hypothetical protein
MLTWYTAWGRRRNLKDAIRSLPLVAKSFFNEMKKTPVDDIYEMHNRSK